jgi:glycosyltransferase involved in cell wall biosynthesis
MVLAALRTDAVRVAASSSRGSRVRDNRSGARASVGADENARLRVLVISHLYPRNRSDISGIFVREQVEALGASADVLVVAGRYGGLASARSADTDRSGPPVIEIGLPWPMWLPSAARVASSIPRYHREALKAVRESGREFDVVHAHFGLPDGLVGVMLGRALSIPAVVTLHGSDFARQLSRPFVGRLLGRRLSRADRIIGVSAHIAEGMRARFGLSEEQVIHLPNGFNDQDIGVHAQRTPRYFVFVGSLIPVKNPDLLLRAFAHIKAQTALDLVYVGDGPMKAQLVHEAEQLGIASRVHFEGQVEHTAIDGYLAEAAALVLPSSSEGMPVVINEALASGTPVVASRLPGIEQQVRSETFGALVPPGDVEALAAALIDMANSAPDYGSIASECKVVSWREHADETLDIYRQLVLRPTLTEAGGSA